MKEQRNGGLRRKHVSRTNGIDTCEIKTCFYLESESDSFLPRLYTGMPGSWWYKHIIRPNNETFLLVFISNSANFKYQLKDNSTGPGWFRKYDVYSIITAMKFVTLFIYLFIYIFTANIIPKKWEVYKILNPHGEAFPWSIFNHIFHDMLTSTIYLHLSIIPTCTALMQSPFSR